MNHKQFLIYPLILFLAIALGACSTSQATLSPTQESQSCPTQQPQSCPTAVAHLPPEINAWRQSITGMGNIIFTFEPGDKCSMKIISKVSSAQWAYDIVVNDDAHLNYGVGGFTINDGYTKADLDEWNLAHPNSQTPAPMTTLFFYSVANPMSRTFTGVTYTGKPIYFVCITQGPDAHQEIESFDAPLEVLPH